MARESPGDDDTTSTSFEAWLDQQAESQGMTREELFEQLVSSYWTLNEMTQLLGESGGGGAPLYSQGDLFDNGNHSSGGSNAPNRESDPNGRRERATDDRQNPDRVQTDAETDLEERIDDLQGQLDTVESDLETEIERGQTRDQLFDALADRLTEVETELGEIATTTESSQEELSARIEQLRADLLERQQSLAEDQDQVEQWLNTEFDSLQTILEYLLNRTDELAAEASSAESRYEREVERLQAERERLDSLKREAAEHEVHEGACEACEETIDLDLLASPQCPHCDAVLTGIDSEQRWWFFTDTVVTVRDSTDESGGLTESFEQRSDPNLRREPTVEESEDAPSEQTAGESPTPSSADLRSDSKPSERQGSSTEQPAGESEKSAPESIDLATPFGDGRDPDEQSRDKDGARTNENGDSSGGDASDASSFEFANEPKSNRDSPVDDSGEDDRSEQTASPFGDLDDLRHEENRSGGSE